MNDNDELKARSIELAERAFRLRDRATTNAAKEGLHSAGNELIMLDDTNRFYAAQSALELYNSWLEDQRSLAHEINVADRLLRGSQSLDITSILNRLEEWARDYVACRDPIVIKIGHSLNSNIILLNSSKNAQEKKEALNYIMLVIETLLEHTAQQDGTSRTVNEMVLLLRAMRDGILVARELSYDEEDLLTKYREEGAVVERLAVARHTVAELYNTSQQ